MDESLLQKIGLSDKNAQIYLALLTFGPSSVRSVAEYTGINRGTVHDGLRWLQEQGMVAFYKKESKQHFVAESPEKLKALVRLRHEELQQADRALEKALPELTALHHKGGERPVARYFSRKELPKILEDLLDTCAGTDAAEYRIYSTEGVREYLYEDFPTFSDVRVAKNISVKVISIGDGGELRGLDARKWLGRKSTTPTYIIIYPGKVASISLDAKGEPIGVVIENDGVFETQKAIFDTLWEKL